MHRSVWGRAGATVLVVGAAFGTLAPVARADDDAVRRRLEREDAFAEFDVHHGACAEERTLVQVVLHEDRFREGDGPAALNTLFGMSIQEFDCAGQPVTYEAHELTTGSFEVNGLGSARVNGTALACRTEEALTCFPLQLQLVITGVGAVDEDRQRVEIEEPDCEIRQRSVRKTRAAEASGTMSFSPPGGASRDLALTNADLSANGANVSTERERTFMRGDGFSCTEH